MRTTLLTLAAIAAPRLVLACPVCFGQNDSPLTQGVFMGVYVMLGITVAVLAAFASFFIYLIRRARLFADAAGEGTADTALGPLSDPQKGTAQC